MAYNTKKYLDEEGLKQVVRLLDEYPDNQILGTVIDEIQGELDKKADVVDIPEVPVQDVQVNGTSILQDGVANVPIAGANNLGVVKYNSNGITGVTVNANGQLTTSPASLADIKNGVSGYKPIGPYRQHEAAFYGLAKAAGADMKDIANITVGIYPDAQKEAIQSMLGITQMLAPENSNLIASQAYSIGDVFAANGHLYKATVAIAQDEAIIPDTNCVETTMEEAGGKIKDVQVTGTSIVVDGVANVPMASQTTLGAVKVNAAYGIQIAADGLISTYPSTLSDIKGGYATRSIISPTNQHMSVFYGLSKVAGVDLANETIALGIYPDNAKIAIRSMLGATSSNVIAVQDTQPTDSDTKIWLPETAETPVEVPTVADLEAGYVKKTDYASSTEGGIVKVSATYGIYLGDNSKCLIIKPAYSATIKAGTNEYQPIVPNYQHYSVFYGLAKAAGDTTQSASDNAVGTYTDGAKIAIKNMLGITHTLTVTVLTQDNVTVTGQTVTVRANSANGEIYATAAYEGQPVSFSVPDGFSYHVSVSDTLDHHFNPTTASGIVTNTDISVTLQYSDFSTIRTARDIKAALNARLDLTDLVGEQITCSKGNDTLKWDVADYDSTTGKIKLLLHDAFGTANMVFEPAQALMWCENGLAAGDYTFADGSTHYYFTLTNAIPAGGQLRADPSSFWTYASQSATSTIETGTVSTTEITGATDLGTCAQGLLNHMSRVRYGSNNFAESALFGWLNSDAAANTPRVPVTKFSRAYSYAQPGFMNGLDPDFVNCLDVVDWLCSTNNVYECPESLGGYTKGIKQAYTVKAKFGLASEMEIFGSYGGNPDGSTVFDLYNGADADDRKKYRGTSVQVWWLRSPSWRYAYVERYVYSSGSAYDYYASYSYGVVPACQISRDTEVTE